METIFSEYGKAIISAIAVAIVIGLLFVAAFYGESGILAGAGTVATVDGDMEDDREADGDVTAVNDTADTYEQTASWVVAGQEYPLSDLYRCSDQTAVISLCAVTDENGDNALGSGAVYDRSAHRVTFQRGIYHLRLRFSGKRVGYADFCITAL